MKKNYEYCCCFMLLLMTFLLLMHGARRKEDALAQTLAPEVLRFHVLAHSDTPEDQALKLAVKEYLLEQLRPHVTSKSEAQDYIMKHREKLEEQTETFIRSLGFSYPAEIRLETCDFPGRTYGDMTFPAGVYDAVRVLIGDGTGRNFWCVLYPSLCYLDTTYAIVPKESKDALQAVIPEADFHALLSARRQKTEQDSLLPRITVRFKLFDWLAF